MTNSPWTDFLADMGVDASLSLSDAPLVDVPISTDMLPDGREVIVYGDVPHDKLLRHPQGENIFSFGNDCGLVSCEMILREFGHQVTENDVVGHAIEAGECEVKPYDLIGSGGATPADVAHLLTDMGVPSHVAKDNSLESLAEKVESGHGTIIGVNAGILWSDPNFVDSGGANHAVVVIGVARDEKTGDIAGFYINDSGRAQVPGDAGRFVSAELTERCHIRSGALCAVTDDPRPANPISSFPSV
jgi:hypothetical protein